MVIYALLIEKGIDDSMNLDRKSFDELINELQKAGVPVPKTGKMKALNKQRVLIKHYAQIAEPLTVRDYFAATEQTLDAIVTHVIGSPIQELYLVSFLADGESKDFLKLAEMYIKELRYMDALVEVRKAIFVEFECSYSIYTFRDYDDNSKDYFVQSLLGFGCKAPKWTRNKEWIEKNVRVPTEYVQIDDEAWRLQAMEFGIHTTELDNLRRLTPAVFRSGNTAEWCISYDVDFPANNGTEANAKYCLDRAIAIILKKKEHYQAVRSPCKDVPFDPPPIYQERAIYEKANTNSKVLHVVSEGFLYTIYQVVSGFDPDQKFYEISAHSETTDDKGYPNESVNGFLQVLPEDD
jgi:hypothetical protein